MTWARREIGSLDEPVNPRRFDRATDKLLEYRIALKFKECTKVFLAEATQAKLF